MANLRRLLDDGKSIFGTDGVRGSAGSELTPELALEIGRAAGSYLRGGPVLVGRDTRRSGTMLASALQAGFHASGIDTIDVGVLPSGGISYLTSETAATMGAIVSASHNPAPDNGIKLLAARGTKLPDEVERELEDRLRSLGTKSAVGPAIGFRSDSEDGYRKYVDHLIEVSRYSLSGIDLALDCAHGSAYKAAPELFDRLNASVEVFGAEPDGTNINDGCGATHPEFLASHSKGRIGFCFDGDADRLIAIDEDGRVANGDVIMAIISRHMKNQGKLKNDIVVATVMSNLGFRKSMAEADIDIIETRVGDRYVMEALLENKGTIGGEQSGHIIFTDHAFSGDGLLTAVQLLNVVAGTGRELRELRAEAITEYPQVLQNVTVGRMADLSGAESLWEEVREVEEELGTDGRVLVRASGTEPLVRVMVEASSEGLAKMYADRLTEATKMSLGQE
ncbi:MAG: phosphoglucosamine mutase [Actinomycetota bacterium]|nr:phosphoglucosamine mutase [Actinomycetota bacterium]